MTEREQAWLPLLDGHLPETGTDQTPDGTLVSWKDLLESADDDNWLVWYHRGVARWYAGDEAGALTAWETSRTRQPNAWASRNLAVCTNNLSDYEQATELAPGSVVPLMVEAINACLEAGENSRAEEIFHRVAPEVREDPRLRLARVRYLLQTGDPAGAEALLDEGIELAGVREGANPLAEYWQRAQRDLGTGRPVPPQYEFGMFGDN